MSTNRCEVCQRRSGAWDMKSSPPLDPLAGITPDAGSAGVDRSRG